MDAQVAKFTKLKVEKKKNQNHCILQDTDIIQVPCNISYQEHSQSKIGQNR